ncbi:MAG: DsbA family protein [bacterium]|nr:DsbA family protein [bacterium]
MTVHDDIKKVEQELNELKRQASMEGVRVEEVHEDVHRMAVAPKQSWMLPAAIVFAALVLGGAIVFRGGGLGTSLLAGAQNPGATLAPAAPQAPQAPAARQDVTWGNTPIVNKNAKVALIEFGDFQCPFCGRFFSDTWPQIKKEYIDSGKVAYQHRDYPLPFHQFAQKSHEASRCALEQSEQKYWELHDWMYLNQTTLDVPQLKNAAKTIGLNTSKFDQCLDSGKHAAAVKADYDAGSSYGVSGTPSFFVNGEIVVGAQPFSTFKQKLDAALAAAK